MQGVFAFSTVTKQYSTVIIDVNGAGEMIFKLHNELIKLRYSYAFEDDIESFVDFAFEIVEFET